MHQISSSSSYGRITQWWGTLSFIVYLLAVMAIIYYDDIQITANTMQEIPTIYNIRIFGIKIIDGIALILTFFMAIGYFFQGSIEISFYHKYILRIFLVYCAAGVVGFIYSFFYNYDYVIWIQDFQQTIYMVGFFFFTYKIIDTKRKWKYFVFFFLTILALKNVLIINMSLSGIGKMIGDWAIRSSQNSEFAYFPMMFFPLLIIFLKTKKRILQLGIIVVLLIYLMNSLLGIYRTVWVMLMLGFIYLLTQLDRPTRIKLIMFGGGGLVITLSAISLVFPRFIELAWGFKFASIFDWSVYGDRSNSTRVLEITNIVHRVFSQFAFIQGMGLGAWWDDSLRRLLPDGASGFTYKSRFYTSHMWYVTQLLKIGLIGMIVYWTSIYFMFKRTSDFIKSLSWDRWEKSILLGLNVGLLCAFISSADFVRLFLVIGICYGIIARFFILDSQERAAI